LAEVLVVTSGKGGVGKTTTSASISTGLAMRGKKTCVIDFDVGLRNLDLVMGCERRVIYDLINVIYKEANLSQALIKDKRFNNLYILPASQTKNKDAVSKEGVGKVIEELKKDFDYIVCDSPAGIEQGAEMAMYFADKALVVANPETSSIRDSDRIIGLLSSKTYRAENDMPPIQESLLITRYNPSRVEDGNMLSVEDIREFLSIPLLGVIPECQSVLDASNTGIPVVSNQKSDAGQAYMDAVNRFLGESIPMRFTSNEKKGFWNMLKGKFTTSEVA
jgi:septum site-determining protein MinD